MNVGDWVYSYSKGIWQIARINKVSSIIPVPSEKYYAFCKRLLNSKHKKAFKTEMVLLDVLESVDIEDYQIVQNFIINNQSFYEDFINFHDPIDSVLNLSFYAKNEHDKESILAISYKIFEGIPDGFTQEKIVENIDRYLYDYKDSIRNFTLQFISYDSEVIESKLIYRSFKSLDF